MKTLTYEQKIISLIIEMDEEKINDVSEIGMKLKNHGFYPANGKNWTSKRIIEILEQE